MDISCPKCKTRYKVSDAAAGKVVRCKVVGCGQVFAAKNATEHARDIATPPPVPPILEKSSGDSEKDVKPAPDAQWYYVKDGERIGPLSESQMAALIKEGKLDRGASVWRSGRPTWDLLESTELERHIAGPPPLTGQHVNNTVVWFLAFAPLVSLWVPHENTLMNWIVPLSLNTVLAYLDFHVLKKGGTDMSKIKSPVWLIPVYLYQRAVLLRQNLTYFIVWIVCLLVAATGNP